jgi:hypothetical protein
MVANWLKFEPVQYRKIAFGIPVLSRRSSWPEYPFSCFFKLLQPLQSTRFAPNLTDRHITYLMKRGNCYE